MREKGFTLIEILIVLVIVALLAVSVLLRSGSQGTENAKRVSDRLRSILIYAQQQAILQPSTLGFDYDKNKGYSFLRYETSPEKKSGEWKPLTTDSILRTYPLPAKIKLIITPSDTHPAIIFFPNGEITSFKIDVNVNNNIKSLYRITGESNGAIQAIKIP